MSRGDVGLFFVAFTFLVGVLMGWIFHFDGVSDALGMAVAAAVGWAATTAWQRWRVRRERPEPGAK